MNSFIIKRLLPFFVCAIGLELIFTLYMVMSNFSEIDWNIITICQNIGTLLLTSMVSFLFMVFPYVIYVTLLPSKMHHGKTDKIISFGAYYAFIFLTCLEEVSSVIFEKEFNLLKEMETAEYIQKAQDIIINIHQSYPLFIFLSIIALCSFIIAWPSRRFLYEQYIVPHLIKRIFYFIIYALISILAFKNIDIEKLETSPNSFNSKLSEEGTYSLFNSFVKKNSRLMILRNYKANSERKCNV